MRLRLMRSLIGRKPPSCPETQQI